MRVLCAFCGLFLAIVIANCSPVVKRDAEEDLSPLNEVAETDDATADDERGDRDKRKIGLKLGVSNGIINFVFDKVDSFIDSKTKALSVLDESNKAKNAAFGIDPKHSATSEFLNKLLSQKVQAATGSIGPIINSAATFFSGASAGITKALAGKIAPLSSLSGGASGGDGTGHADGGAGGGSSAFIGNLLSQKIGSLSSLSQGSGGLGSLSGGLGGLSGGSSGGDQGSSGGASSGGTGGANAGINLGAFANLAGYDYTPPQAAYYPA
ncbi:PREDICTED: keratin, type II cytoskeletal 1 isoform X2 [Wasmannia auropunctata]|uniref:keratin, type II cytoskeletal 1 isoform X2 n=1 Tax=Wasmannia auropunctata TaxID=64793 RepID=UPI0005F004CA|nr:PREDICTED: keratin, type II cytoskeletal 1 isoform X2 [Wasmannia auropunctata]